MNSPDSHQSLAVKQISWLLNLHAGGWLKAELQARVGALLQERQQELDLSTSRDYLSYLEQQPEEVRCWAPLLALAEPPEAPLPAAGEAVPRARSGKDWLQVIEQIGEVTTWEFRLGVGVVHLSGSLAEAIRAYLDPEQEFFGLLNLVHPLDRAWVRDVIRTVLREARDQDLSYRIQLPGGQIRYLRDRIRPTTDAQGRLNGLLGVKVDLTTIKVAERRLAESEERYRRLVEDMQVPIMIHQEEKVVFANQAALKAVRAQRKEDFLGMHLGQLVAENLRDSWLVKLQELYRAGEVPLPHRAEITVRRLDGTTMHVEAGGMPITYGGQPAGQLYFLDISEQREVFHLLVQSQLRLDLSQEIAQVGFWEYDYETDLAWWSDALYKIFGVAKTEEPPSQDYFVRLVHPDDVALVHHHLEQTEKHDAPYEFDHRVRRADGELRYFHVRGYLFRNEAGQPQRLIGVTQDITERKQREREIERLAQTLERRVTQRTKALEASNDELRRFAYSVSHDLRAPLRHLISYSQLLSKHYHDHLDEVGQEFLGFISQAASRMDDQVAGLLTYSRLGQHLLEPEWVDSGEMIRALWPSLLTAEQRAEVTLRVGELPPVQADAFLLEQVWANLLSNAIKYSSQRSQPRIVIEGQEQGEQVIYQITDNGIGFDMKDAHRLFTIFQRLPGSQAFEGTGIGLANAKRVIDRHQGEIWAEAKPGQGATFFIKLPRLSPAVEPESP